MVGLNQIFFSWGLETQMQSQDVLMFKLGGCPLPEGSLYSQF